MKKSIYEKLQKYIGNSDFFGQVIISLRGGVVYKFEINKSENLKDIEEAWKELTPITEGSSFKIFEGGEQK